MIRVILAKLQELGAAGQAVALDDLRGAHYLAIARLKVLRRQGFVEPAGAGQWRLTQRGQRLGREGGR